MLRLIVVLIFALLAGLIDKNLGGGVLLGAIITALVLKKD
jgi:hypothetical protein